MKKNLLLLFLAALICIKASAQFNYTFKDTTDTYVPLSGGTSLNGSLIWDEEDLIATMPFTWKMDNSISLNKFNLGLSFSAVLSDLTNFSDINGFVLGDMDIADRGILDNISSMSPIKTTTVGSAPNRIFKAELANAGFYEEYDVYNTMSDSFNLQIWIYETSNIVELHYGPSKVSHPADYFGFGSGPLVFYAKHIDASTGNSGEVYSLAGSPAAATLDSAALPNFPSGALSSWPANGQVFRFTPNGCTAPTAAFSAAAPSGKTVQYTYSGSTSSLDSLVWNFGDGQMQTITTGFAAPLTHLYAADGHYTVSVTAYTSCGSNTATQTQALAVNGISFPNKIRVYPNPAKEVLVIEGMEAGTKGQILSILGQEMMRFSIQSDKQTLDLKTLPAGMYMLMLTDTDGASTTVRFAKK